jgi:molybdopterin synthase sulfur carrier subunit
MALRVLFLGRLQDMAGHGSVEAVCVATVDRLIASFDPALGAALRSDKVRVAVNGALVSRDAAIADGDEVAFLPPVSGG